ncbi:MAG TPA: restriction endonuclease subunit S [Fuerstia sp.]|nr:restriction endonuclease subunit S [Fuerstiella sp.]
MCFFFSHFVFYLLKHLRSTLVEIARNKQTTGLGHVTVADMKRLYVCTPPSEVLTECDEVLGPIYDRCFANTRESSTLSTLRDTLLPKLLSGELPVPAALTATEEAT